MGNAGRVIDDHAQRLLRKSGYSFSRTPELDILNDIKEKLCFVAKDYDAELTTALSSSEYDYVYALPEGNQITVKGAIRMQIPELIFNP